MEPLLTKLPSKEDNVAEKSPEVPASLGFTRAKMERGLGMLAGCYDRILETV
jgi:hypothetical protein